MLTARKAGLMKGSCLARIELAVASAAARLGNCLGCALPRQYSVLLPSPVHLAAGPPWLSQGQRQELRQHPRRRKESYGSHGSVGRHGAGATQHAAMSRARTTCRPAMPATAAVAAGLPLGSPLGAAHAAPLPSMHSPAGWRRPEDAALAGQGVEPPGTRRAPQAGAWRAPQARPWAWARGYSLLGQSPLLRDLLAAP